jgi:hypothetical protein
VVRYSIERTAEYVLRKRMALCLPVRYPTTPHKLDGPRPREESWNVHHGHCMWNTARRTEAPPTSFSCRTRHPSSFILHSSFQQHISPFPVRTTHDSFFIGLVFAFINSLLSGRGSLPTRSAPASSLTTVPVRGASACLRVTRPFEIIGPSIEADSLHWESTS